MAEHGFITAFRNCLGSGVLGNLKSMDVNGVIRPLSDGSGCSPIQLKLES